MFSILKNIINFTRTHLVLKDFNVHISMQKKTILHNIYKYIRVLDVKWVGKKRKKLYIEEEKNILNVCCLQYCGY